MKIRFFNQNRHKNRFFIVKIKILKFRNQKMIILKWKRRFLIIKWPFKIKILWFFRSSTSGLIFFVLFLIEIWNKDFSFKKINIFEDACLHKMVIFDQNSVEFCRLTSIEWIIFDRFWCENHIFLKQMSLSDFLWSIYNYNFVLSVYIYSLKCVPSIFTVNNMLHECVLNQCSMWE